MVKKSFFILLFSLACRTLHALPFGNPSEPALFLNGVFFNPAYFVNPKDPCFMWWDAWGFRVGFYGDYVFDRHISVVDESDESHVDTFRMSTNAAYFSLNFYKWVNVFATVGQTRIRFRFNEDIFVQKIESEVSTKSEFSWSVGGHAVLAMCRGFALGLEGQYFSVKEKLDSLVDFSSGTVFHFGDEGNKFRYTEWQVGVGVSYKVATFCPRVALVPYLGLKWSDAKFNLNRVFIPQSVFQLPNLHTDRHIGYVVGGSLTLCEAAGVTVEGRWGDEKAIYVNGQFRF